MNFSEIKSNFKRLVLEKEVAVSTTVSELECGGVSKVLGVQAVGRIVNIDVQSGSAKCFIRVNYKLLFLNSDNETRGLDYFADFTENIQIDTSSDKICGLIDVIDTDVTISGGIKLSSAIDIGLYAVEDEELSILTSVDDMYAEKKSFTYAHLIGSKEETFSESTDIDTKIDVEKILYTDLRCVVDRTTAGMGNVLIQGKIVGEIAYLNDGKIVVDKISLPYTEEYEFEGVEIGDVVRVCSGIKSYRVTLTGVEGSNILHIEAEVTLGIFVFENPSVEYVTDVFSVERELNVEYKDASVKTLLEPKYLDGSVSTIAEIPENESSVLEVLGVIAEKNAVAKSFVEDNKITIEGVYSATILYRSEDGLSSVDLEIPYSLPFDLEGAKSSDDILSIGVVISSVATLKRAREIEIEGSLGFSVEMDENNTIRYIADIKEGEEKEMNISAVSVYIVGENESIYDVAKALSARPDDILSQNSDITEPLKEGDKLFYFRGITFDF